MILYVFLVLIIASCLTKSNVGNKFDLTTEKTIVLEENEDVILPDISDAVIFDGKLVVSSVSANLVVEYSLHSGKILNYAKPDISLCDSLALSGKQPYPHFGRKYKFLTTNEVNELHGVKQDVIDKFLKRVYFRIQKLKDQLIILTHLNSYISEIGTDNITVTNAAGLIHLDKNLKVQKVITCQNIPGSYAITRNFFICDSNDILISVCHYPRQYEYNLFDSLPALSLYDSKGYFKKIIAYLPFVYEKSKLGYKLFSDINFCKIEDNIFYSFPYDDKIHNFTKNSFFSLKNLPKNYNEGLKYLNQNENIKLYQQTLNKLLPIFVDEIINYKNYLLVVISVSNFDKINNREVELILQKYTINGELKSETKIDNALSEGIQKIIYDGDTDRLYIFKKNYKGWTVEISKIEES